MWHSPENKTALLSSCHCLHCLGKQQMSRHPLVRRMNANCHSGIFFPCSSDVCKIIGSANHWLMLHIAQPGEIWQKKNSSKCASSTKELYLLPTCFCKTTSLNNRMHNSSASKLTNKLTLPSWYLQRGMTSCNYARAN